MTKTQITKELKPKCLYCKKTIRCFGNARKNGDNKMDWHTRKYCLKCYKILH